MNSARQQPDPLGIPHVQFPLPHVPEASSIPAAVAHAMGAFDRPRQLTVLINDPQRNVGTQPVLEEIARHVAPAGIRILVATGSHSFTPAQKAAFEQTILGDAAPAPSGSLPSGRGSPEPAREGGSLFRSSSFRPSPLASRPSGSVEAFAWHDCRSRELVRVEDAWTCHPWLLEDRPLVAIGSVEPHYFAGFTGAHKTATIGCAAWCDIESNHSHALSPLCRPCRLEDNPVYEGVADMLWVLLARRPLACVNLVQVGPDVVAAYGGEPFATLTAAAPVAARAFARRVDSPLDAVVATVTGSLGQSFYQADKGIKNNEWAVRDGGCIVLVAPCPDGVGQDDFVRLLREASTHRQAADLVARRGYRLGDHKAVRLRYLTDPACRGVRVFLVSRGVSPDQAAVLSLTAAPDVAAALREGGIDPRRHRVAAVDDAGNRCLLPGDSPA